MADNTNPTASGTASLNTGGGEGALGGMADSMGALTNITKGLAGVVEGIFQVMSKLFNAIMDASPLLQGMLKIIDKMFKLVLMPIGNMIGRLLMPYVIRMAKRTSDFLSKYGNAGPDKMADVMAEGMTIALESMVDMLMVVLTKVLWPLLKGLGQALINAFQYIFSGGTAGKLGFEEPAQNLQDMIGSDLKDLMGNATTGFADIINTFGLTVQTGNRITGNSFAESATIFYKGTADIANGFQSVHDVLIIGTTKAIEEANRMFNLSAAGFVEVINTVEMPFELLVEKLNAIIATLPEVPPAVVPPEEPPTSAGGGGFNLGKFIATFGGIGAISMLADKAGYKNWLHTVGTAREPTPIGEGSAYSHYLGMANGGIVTRPTRILAGEAGTEAIIPLNRGGTGIGQSVNIHFHGDVYGMEDFDRKVEKSVSKYSGRVRGAY